MKIEIKNIFTGEVIFSHESDNNTIRLTLELAVNKKQILRGADLRNAYLRNANLSYADFSGVYLRNANLSYANLRDTNLRDTDFRGADFRGADFRGADFRGADLNDADLRNTCIRNAIGNKKEIRSLQLSTWNIVFNMDLKVMAIGCEEHTFGEWKNFTDKEISKMDYYALEWWKKWKEFIFMAIELSEEKS